MPELLNCPRCGKLFVKALRSVCEACHKEEEEKYQTVYQYIRKRENRMATMAEVHEATGVEQDIIVKFVKQGRIQLSMFPNLAYPCESCGKMIREGRICGVCKGNIASGLEQLEKEKKVIERNRQQERSKYTTYHSLKNKLDQN